MLEFEKDHVKGLSGFPWTSVDKCIEGVTLKMMVQAYCTYKGEFSLLQEYAVFGESPMADHRFDPPI
jgi:hypothetical protein